MKGWEAEPQPQQVARALLLDDMERMTDWVKTMTKAGDFKSAYNFVRALADAMPMDSEMHVYSDILTKAVEESEQTEVVE